MEEDDSHLVEKYKAVLNFITTKSWEVNDITQPISEINGYLRKQTAMYVVYYLFGFNNILALVEIIFVHTPTLVLGGVTRLWTYPLWSNNKTFTSIFCAFSLSWEPTGLDSCA